MPETECAKVLVLLSWDDLRMYDSVYLVDLGSRNVSAQLSEVLKSNAEIDGGAEADVVWDYCRRVPSIASTHLGKGVKADKIVLVYIY